MVSRPWRKSGRPPFARQAEEFTLLARVFWSLGEPQEPLPGKTQEALASAQRVSEVVLPQEVYP